MISSTMFASVTGVRVTSIGNGWITFRFDTAQGFHEVVAHVALGASHDFDTIDIPATVRDAIEAAPDVEAFRVEVDE